MSGFLISDGASYSRHSHYPFFTGEQASEGLKRAVAAAVYGPAASAQRPAAPPIAGAAAPRGTHLPAPKIIDTAGIYARRAAACSAGAKRADGLAYQAPPSTTGRRLDAADIYRRRAVAASGGGALAARQFGAGEIGASYSRHG